MNHPLKNALPIVAAAYGEKFGVRVLIRGQGASTDGNCIIIPAIDPDNQHLQQIVWGYLAHEAAHIRYTNFDMVEKSASSPIRKALLNIIEDVRIEKALVKEYPGTRRTILQVISHMVSTHQMRSPESNEPIPNLQAWLLFRLRNRVLGQSLLEPLYQSTDKRIRQILPVGVMSRLSAMLTSVPSLASTSDALSLADAILTMFEEEAQQPPSQEKDKASAGAGESGTEGQPSHADASASSAAECTQKQQQNLEAVLSATDEQLSQDTFSQVADALAEAAEDAEHSQGVASLNLPQAEQALIGDKKILAVSASESAQIRARLRGMVQSSQDNRHHPKRQGTRIATHRLAASQVGESRLFIKKSPRVSPNASVHLLIDISGSMGTKTKNKQRRYCDIANEAALALSLALEAISGVSIEVSYFPGINEGVAKVLSPRQSVRHKAAYFDQQPRGSTPLAQAMWFAARQLLAQKEKRKIMLVLTDGKPDDIAATLDIIDRCECSGFELFGIGIQTHIVQQFFRKNIVIHNVSDLKHELFSITQHLLIR